MAAQRRCRPRSRTEIGYGGESSVGGQQAFLSHTSHPALPTGLELPCAMEASTERAERRGRKCICVHVSADLVHPGAGALSPAPDRNPKPYRRAFIFVRLNVGLSGDGQLGPQRQSSQGLKGNRWTNAKERS